MNLYERDNEFMQQPQYFRGVSHIQALNAAGPHDHQFTQVRRPHTMTRENFAMQDKIYSPNKEILADNI